MSGRTPPEGEGGASAQAPSFTDEQWVVLRSLAPPELPGAVPDVSNAFADDERAAKLGQRLFFDPLLSGKLLDEDNDGGPNSLGKRGESGKVACSGCHLPGSAFTDTRSTFQEISLGAGWTHRRSPSLLDVGQASIVMWAGRHSTLWSQPFGPFENPLEMNSSRLFVAQQVAARYEAEYEAAFGKGSLGDIGSAARIPKLSGENTGCKLTSDVPRPRALPPDKLYECHGVPGDGAEFDGLSGDDQTLVTRIVTNVGKALAAYQRQLTCGPSRFDAWVHGDATALSLTEQQGLEVFIGKGECASCHSGPYLSDQKFHNVGLKEVPTREGIFNGNDRGAAVDLIAAKADPVGIHGPFSDGDDGRLPKTIDAAYEGAFRTPTLRCVARRPTFMHTGTLLTLDSVVSFFSIGGDQDGFPGKKEITPLGLSREEVSSLVAFMKALDGPGPSQALLDAGD